MNNKLQFALDKDRWNRIKKKRKIQILRTIIQAIATFFISYGAFVFGQSQSKVIIPVFQCVYINSKTASGICKTLTNVDGMFQNMTGSSWIFFIFMIISVLIIGKIWCGYLCPFGFFQDVLTIIRKKFKIAPIDVPRNARSLTKLIKWGLLICLLFGIGFCRLCPVKYIMQPLSGSYPGFNLWGIIIAGFVAGVCFMKESAFCEVCPLGTLMGLINKITGAKIKKNGSACTHCRACLEVCPMGIESVYQLRNKQDVTHPDCIFCMKCIDACPEKGVLSLSILNKEIISSKRGTEKWNKELKKDMKEM